MQYTQGTVNVTNGSNKVIGNNVQWSQLPFTLPCVFHIDSSSITNKIYEVVKIVDASNIVYLSDTFQGTTINGVDYFLTSDYTPRYKLPLTIPTEYNIEQVVTEAVITLENTLLQFDTIRGTKAIDNRVGTYEVGSVNCDASSAIVTGVNTCWDTLEDCGTLYFKLWGDTTIYKISSIDGSSQLTLETPYYTDLSRATWPTQYEIVRDVTSNFKLPLLSINMDKPWAWVTYIIQMFEDIINQVNQYLFFTIINLNSSSTVSNVDITTSLVTLSIDSVSSTSALSTPTVLHGLLLVVASLASSDTLSGSIILTKPLILSSLASLSSIMGNTSTNVNLQLGDLALNFERMKYDGTNSIAKYFVQLPIIYTDQNTDFYVYYGSSNTVNKENKAFTWDDDFVCVLHGDDRDNGSVFDSTRYYKSALKSNTIQPSEVDGYISKAQYFNIANSEYLSILNDGNTFHSGTKYTISLWYKGSVANYNVLFSDFYNGQGKCFALAWGIPTFYRGSEFLTSSGTVSDDTYTKLTATYDGSNLNLIINNTYIDTSSVSGNHSISGLGYSYLGCMYDIYTMALNYFQDGSTCEFKYSKTNRSTLWSILEYYSETNDLLTYGTEETGPYTVFNNTYTYRRKLTVDYTKFASFLPTYNAAILDFPVLVTLDSSTFSFNHVTSNGYDLMFLGYEA